MKDKFCKVCITSLYNTRPCINKICKHNAYNVKIADSDYSETVQYLDTEYCKGYKFESIK